MTSTPVSAAADPATRLRNRVLAVAGATVAAVVVWGIAVLVGVDPQVTMAGAPMQIGVVAVILNALVPSLLGWALLAILERRTQRARTIWTAVALVVTLLSLAGPLTSAADPGSMTTLIVLHLVVAAVLVPALRRS
ncbi:DUF6069 family protein [Pseudonocardia sp. TRM90224]|uniref:DUF6069 family protein n=1 Tax=Pseudonocardia sp. TRM90224 TaxID=2812678 RepID=UPI001E2DADEB|nr:DUF6069 family protein [Pseudonocardia sp. TRM90224]